MYGFVDTTERASNTLMSIQTIFNGYNLDKLLTDDKGTFRTLVVSGRGNVEYDLNTMGIFGMHGVHEDDNSRRFPREITVKFQITANSNGDMRDKFDYLRSLLMGSKQVLEFTDEEYIYYATMQVLDVPEEESNDLICTMTFLCSDPDKYGQEKTLRFPADAVVIENKGTAEANPIFELTTKKKTTFAMVTKGDEEYNLIGQPADDDVEIIDDKQKVYGVDGMTGWTTSGIVQDNRFGTMTGTMQHDGTGLRPNNFGTGDKVHGPAVIRELPESLENFEVDAIFDVISERNIDNFRLQIDLFDENMNKIGMLGIKDNNRFENIRVGLGRVGPYRGGGKSNGYLIGEDNYTKTFSDNTLMHMKFKREGNKFDLQIGRWRVNRLQELLRESLVTRNYNGKLKYIQVAIGSYGDRAKPARLRINKIDVFKLAKLTVDQTPYILYPGDVVTFDHKNDDILVNGEPRMDLKNFGGSFFNLDKGDNLILVSPEDSFDAKVAFRDKYL